MAKPRIFISSTYYDLKHIRKSIESFVDGIGYESVLFESGDVAFEHDQPLDESCYKELDSCHILVLVIGGRYGSKSSDEILETPDEEIEKHYQHFNSITRKEYEAARDRDIPIYIFVEKGVSAEYQTYRENRDNESIKYAHVDSVNIFRLIDSIHSQSKNNLIREFENVDDITNWLKDQWAGLFSQFLIKKTEEKPIISLEKQLTNLGVVTQTLKDYSENIIRGMSPDESEKIITTIGENEKHRSAMTEFINNSEISHLLDDHEINKEELFLAFRSSKTVEEFQEILKDMFEEDDECYLTTEDYSEDLLSEELSGFNELRGTLGFELWGDITSKSSGRKKTRR